MGFYNNMIKYVGGIIRGVFRVTLVGAENIPADTEDSGTPAYLLCANHLGLFDPFVIGATIRVKIYWMAKASLFRVPLVKQIIEAFGAFPVSRGTGDVGAIKKTVEQLQHSRSVGIFPQGHRNPGVNPRGTPLRYGAGMIAFRSGCDILPICIETKKRRLRPFCRTVILVGKRIPYAELGMTEGHTEDYRRATEYIFDRICKMSEEYRASVGWDGKSEK